MNFLKIINGISVAAMEISKALSDRELTLKEICDITDGTLRATIGTGLDGIGLKIEKTDNGTKVTFVINNG